MNILAVSILQKWPLSTQTLLLGRGEERSLALIGVEVGERGAQLSLGRVGTLARAGSSRVYMSIPRRNMASCSRSSWSWSSTGVWFMGEKPRAGTPTCRGQQEPLGGRPAPRTIPLPTLLQAAHRAKIAAVCGSGEDLRLQGEVPVEGRTW